MQAVVLVQVVEVEALVVQVPLEQLDKEMRVVLQPIIVILMVAVVAVDILQRVYLLVHQQVLIMAVMVALVAMMVLVLFGLAVAVVHMIQE
jgi:hypothetical protein